MGGGLLRYLIPSGLLGVCYSRTYSEHPQIASQQVIRFCSGLQPGWYKIKDIHGTPHRVWV